jgi:hypothetical protein
VVAAVEAFEQFVDVLVGALHRREAAGVFARQRFRASPIQRNEKILTEERPQVTVSRPMTSGRFPVGQACPASLAPPGFIQRQQALMDGRIDRSAGRAVVEQVESGDPPLAAARLGFQQDLADQRGDGLDGMWHAQQTGQRDAGIVQARVNALADRPDQRFFG